MNFLAHQYLSGNNDGLRIGNFIGDLVKGNKWQEYSVEIQQGILLHRSIDDFTDTHLMVKESVNILKPRLGRYSAIANDIFFDHFLAKNWSAFSDEDLELYVQKTYLIVKSSLNLLPDKAAFILEYMQKQNWLYNYQFISGIEKTMNGMSRRTQATVLENSHLVLLENYDALKSQFDNFFPLLQEHVRNVISQKK